MSAENCETHFRACDCIEVERKNHRECIRLIIEKQAQDPLIWYPWSGVHEAEYLRRALRELTAYTEEYLDWEDSLDGS